MDISDFKLVRLNEDYDIKPFDCGEKDLNEFLFNDSKEFQREFLAITYLLEKDDITIAYFSLLNDKINIHDLKVEDKKAWNKIRKKYPQRKRLKSYPCMKIGRLGVSSDYQGKGIGKMILDYLKVMFISNNRTGCRYITLDGYRNSLNFYQRNDFVFLTSGDIDDETRLMYFDLKTLSL